MKSEFVCFVAQSFWIYGSTPLGKSILGKLFQNPPRRVPELFQWFISIEKKG